MSEERRLMAIGFPIEDAISICNSMRKEGNLNKFIEEQEYEYRTKCLEYLREVID